MHVPSSLHWLRPCCFVNSSRWNHLDVNQREASFFLSADLIHLSQVILAEVLCDCSSSQAVVKELRVSASPLEQRKFLAESEPYRLEKALKSTTLWEICDCLENS